MPDYPSKIKYMKKYRTLNKAKISEYNRQHYAKNKARILEKKREQYHAKKLEKETNQSKDIII